jgi:hypothetical protein
MPSQNQDFWSQFEEVKDSSSAAPASNQDFWSQFEEAKTPEKEAVKPRERPQGSLGILSDTLSSVLNMPSEFVKYLKEGLPQQTVGLAEQFVSDPDKAIKRMPLLAGAGIAEDIKGLINLPGVAAEELGKRGFSTPEAIGKALKPYKIGDTGTEKLFLGKPQPGDELVKNIAGALPFGLAGRGARGLKGLGKRLTAGGTFAGTREGNVVQGAILNTLPEMIMRTAEKAGGSIGAARNRGALREKVAGAEEEFAASEQQLKQLQDSLKERFSESSPEVFERGIAKQQEQVGELQPQADIPFEKTEGLLPGATGEGMIPEAQRNIDATHKEISSYLNEGETHDVEAADLIHKAIKARKKEIGRSYEDVKDELKDKNVFVPRDADVKEIEDGIKKIFKQSQWNSPEFERVKSQALSSLGANNKLDIVPAQNFVQQLRDTKAAANEAGLRGYKEGASPEEQRFWQEENKKLKILADKQYSLLKNSVPPESLKKLDTANKRWATEVAPLYKVNTYQQIKHDGRINSKNIMDELRGPNAGRVILREIIKDNPKIGRHIVGQRYAAKPHELTDVNKEVQQYIDELPQLQGMINRMREGRNKLKFAESKAGKLTDEAARIKEGFKETLEKQRQRKQAVDKINKLNKQIKSKEDAANLLRKKIAIKGQSEAKLSRLREQLEEAESKIKKLNSNLKKALKFAKTVAGIVVGEEVLKKMLR